MSARSWRITLLVLLALAGLFVLVRWTLLPRVDQWPALNGEVLERVSRHGELERSYRVYRPANLPNRAGVLLVFHGSMSDGAGMRSLSGHQFDRLADEQGLLVVYPDGIEQHWNDCRGRAAYAANRRNIDDVGFVRQLLVELDQAFGIDDSRVFATGFSNGGHMALRLALEAPALIRAVAPIAANLPAPDDFDCHYSGEPVSIALFAGSRDPVNPYEGGLVKILWDDSRGVVLSAPATARYFAELAGYREPPQHERLANPVAEDDSYIELERWQGRDHEVRLYSVMGGGHNFPARHIRFGPLLGGDNRDADVADLMWDFFGGLDAP